MRQGQNLSCSEVRCYHLGTMIVWSELAGCQIKSSVLHRHLGEDRPHLIERVVRDLQHSENTEDPSQYSFLHHCALFFVLLGVQCCHSLASSSHPLDLVFSQT